MKKKFLTIITLIMFYTLAFCQCVKAETQIKTTIQIKKGATSWTSISVSDAYDKCQELNEDNSALGTTSNNVMAHLSTNADWYAVSLLAFSNYGSKGSSNTTGNNSGIMNFGTYITFTAGLMDGYLTNNTLPFKSLIDNIDSPFVEKVYGKTNRENTYPGLGFRISEALNTTGNSYDDKIGYPISTRSGLFEVNLGYHANNGVAGNGVANSKATFRPVIWVK